jgi:putative hemolysin
LVIGELVPKQIALRDPEKIAVRVAPAMTALLRPLSRSWIFPGAQF